MIGMASMWLVVSLLKASLKITVKSCWKKAMVASIMVIALMLSVTVFFVMLNCGGFILSSLVLN